jgi:hypothetical protein
MLGTVCQGTAAWEWLLGREVIVWWKNDIYLSKQRLRVCMSKIKLYQILGRDTIFFLPSRVGPAGHFLRFVPANLPRVKATSHMCLVSKLKMRGDIIPLLHTSSWHGASTVCHVFTRYWSIYKALLSVKVITGDQVLKAVCGGNKTVFCFTS